MKLPKLTKEEKKEMFIYILKRLPAIVLIVLLSGVAGTIAHEHFHAWSLKDVTLEGKIFYLNSEECGSNAIACYTSYLNPAKEVEYKQKLKTEELKAYGITFAVMLIVSMILLYLSKFILP